MSRNFELLRQASWSQEFFQDMPTEAPTEVPSRDTNRRRMKRPPPGNDQVSVFVRRAFLNPHNPSVRSIMFAGLYRRAGCTWTCAQTAKILADSVDGDICAVDTNFHAPALHHHFLGQPQGGLSDAMCASKPAAESAKQVNGSNLWLVPVGYQNERARSMMDSTILEKHLRELRNRFDYLLIDGVLQGSGTGVPAGCRAVDGVVLVAESGGIEPKMVFSLRRRLESAHVPLLGVVLNQRLAERASMFERLIR